MSGFRDAVAQGRLCRETNYSTTIHYFGQPSLTPLLRDLITLSALPLQDVEVDFAQDSTGFASTAYNRWFDHKWGGGGNRKAVKWVKFHAMCGVQSNIITVADATIAQSADTTFMPEFVRVTAEHFNIREVSADKAYSSRKNIRVVADAGGQA